MKLHFKCNIKKAGHDSASKKAKLVKPNFSIYVFRVCKKSGGYT